MSHYQQILMSVFCTIDNQNGMKTKKTNIKTIFLAIAFVHNSLFFQLFQLTNLNYISQLQDLYYGFHCLFGMKIEGR